MLRARKPLYREWLEKHGVNDFLKRAQKTTRFRDLVVEKFAAVYGLLMVEEVSLSAFILRIVFVTFVLNQYLRKIKSRLPSKW